MSNQLSISDTIAVNLDYLKTVSRLNKVCSHLIGGYSPVYCKVSHHSSFDYLSKMLLETITDNYRQDGLMVLRISKTRWEVATTRGIARFFKGDHYSDELIVDLT